MATSKDPTAKTDTPTKEDAPVSAAVDECSVNRELEHHAFEIFKDMASSAFGATRSVDAVAKMAFQKASEFLKVRDGVRDGSVSLDPPEAIKPQKVKVPRMRAKSDSTPAVFEPVLDANRQPIIDEILADHFAYCPNAPPDHPANARFVPLDGTTREEHISRTKAELAALN